MTNISKKTLGFAQGTLGVRNNMKREVEQPVDLVQVFGSRGIDFTGGADI